MPSRKWRLRLILFAASTVLCTAAASLVASTSIGGWIELRTYDLRFKLRGPLQGHDPAPITLLAIDENALNKIPEPLMLWHRVFARTINLLVSERAAVIGIDFVFSAVGKYDPEGERLLSESLLRAGSEGVPVVLAYRIQASGVEQPADAVRFAALAAGHTMGYANLTTDSDDFVRRQQILALSEGRQAQQGFALAVADAYAKKYHSDLSLNEIENYTILINFRGAGRFDRVSLADLVQPETSRSGLANKIFRDRIVLIGRIGGAGDEDLHSTPQYFASNAVREGESRRTPGVEIHANALATLLAGDRLRPLSPSRQLCVTLLVVMAVSFFCFRFGPATALVSTAIIVLGFLGLSSIAAFKHGWWVLLVAPVTGSLLAFGTAEVANYLLEGREKRRLRNVFKRYVNDQVIERILQSPRDVALKGERKQITVLFADIRDFTTRAERTPAEALLKILNEYFTAMVTVIQDHNGMVDKFIGDGLMAVFGVPIDDPEAPAHAVQAARAMFAALEKLNKDLVKKGAEPISIGAGIHTGEAVVGNVGSVRKMEYTAIGDVVNVASRIEGLTRKLGREILISGDTFQALQGSIRAEALGEETVKGRFRPISVYAVPTS